MGGIMSTIGTVAGTYFGGPIGGAIGGSIGGAIDGSMASDDASSAQTNSANSASATQMAMFNKTQANLQPYMTSGTQNLDALNGMLKSGQLGGQFTNADLNANMAPNYQFQLQQGQQALQNGQAAQNGALSGAAMKEMQNFTQNTAAGAYQNAYSNWLNTQNMNFGQRSSLATMGQNAAAGVGTAAMQTGQGIANNTIGAGNAQAAGIIAGQNSLTGGMNNANGLSMFNQMQGNSSPFSSLSSLFGGGSSGGGSGGTWTNASADQAANMLSGF